MPVQPMPPGVPGGGPCGGPIQPGPPGVPGGGPGGKPMITPWFLHSGCHYNWQHVGGESWIAQC